MIDTRFRQAYKELMEVHAKIRAKFADIDRDFLGELYTREHLGEVLEHGDGYTLRSIPTCIDEIMNMISDTELVLIVAKFPYLSKNSEFNPHESLTDIHYWRNDVELRTEVGLKGGQVRKFQFWVWQNDCPVHKNFGKARDNQKRLLDHCPQLCQVLEDQRRVSGHFVTACKEWLHVHGRELKVFEHRKLDNEVYFAIKQLRGDASVSYRCTDVFEQGKVMDLLTENRVG